MRRGLCGNVAADRNVDLGCERAVKEASGTHQTGIKLFSFGRIPTTSMLVELSSIVTFNASLCMYILLTHTWPVHSSYLMFRSVSFYRYFDGVLKQKMG